MGHYTDNNEKIKLMNSDYDELKEIAALMKGEK